MKPPASAAFARWRCSPIHGRSASIRSSLHADGSGHLHPPSCPPVSRAFATTTPWLDWLTPKRGHKVKSRKGRPRVATGGSVRGTTVVWGDYGLRMKDHDRRVSASQLAIGAETIKKRLRGERYKLYKRVCANIAVYTSGNEVRMGKGKGSFDYWASRVAVNKIIFELKGDVHEQVVHDAFRLAAAKMPGQYEVVKKGDPPIMGMTKMINGMTLEDLKKPWLPVPAIPPPPTTTTTTIVAPAPPSPEAAPSV